MGLHSCVIVNPTSGGGATGRRWPALRSALDRVLGHWDHHFTLAPGDATRLARLAARDGYEMVVVVGGDGTANEVVSGLFEEDAELGVGERPIREDLVLGVVRQGTGGDFARLLGLTSRLPGAVAHLEGSRSRPIDLGLVEFVGHDGRPGRRAFLNISSFGLSGLVVDKVNATSKSLGARGSFMLGLGRALAAHHPVGVRVEVDGRALHDGVMVTGAVANGQYFGGGMRIAPDAAPDDGQLDVTLLLRQGLREVLAIGDVYSGKAADWATARRGRGSEVTARPLDPATRVLLDVDGEQPGTLPARFRLVPAAVRLKTA